jgi:hypothetical protein
MTTKGTTGPHLRARTQLGPLWVGGLLLSSALWLLMISGHLNLLCAVLLAGLFLLVYLCDKAIAITVVFGYLILLGDIRRILAVLVGQPSLDLLLLIAPGMAALLAMPLFFPLRLKESLSKAMLALLVLMAVEIANPSQGGISIGFSGAFFYLVPVLWFWIGRSMGSPALVERLLYRLVLPLALLAAVLGLAQSFLGFLPYQQVWITSVVSSVYSSLYVGSSIRPFGFSVSAAEYATLLEFSIAAIVAAFLASRRVWLLAIPVLATALLLASGRGTMIKLTMTLPIVWVISKNIRFRLRTLIGIAVLAVASLICLSFVSSRLAPPANANAQNDSAAQSALTHQLSGLAHPFDQRYSSAGLHSTMIFNGILEGFLHPLGRGLGATTIAAVKFSGNDPPSIGSSEFDLSDVFTDLGAIGGLLYLAIAVLTARAALRYLRTTPRPISLPVLAILVSTLGAWLIAGQYSTCSLLFFLIGALVYPENQSPPVPAIAHSLIKTRAADYGPKTPSASPVPTSSPAVSA